MRARHPGVPVTVLPWSGSSDRGCNRDATAAVGTRGRTAGLAVVALVVVLATATRLSAAQEPQRASAEAAGSERRAAASGAGERDGVSAGSVTRFLLGGVVGLGLHESGHLATDVVFGAQPGVKRVSFGPMPFFALTHDKRLSPRREFTVSSAGFLVQQLGNEILLDRHPALRSQRAPLRKGMFAFNVLASAAYAGAAIAKVGPPERDTRSMAEFLGVDEGVVGAMVLSPAALDVARYYHPGNRWLKWSSRAVKIGMVCLVARRAAN